VPIHATFHRELNGFKSDNSVSFLSLLGILHHDADESGFITR